MLAQEPDDQPQQIIINGNQVAAEQWVSHALPDQLQNRVVYESTEFWSLVHQSSTDEPLNLLQGEFAPSLPWGKWWRYWQLAAVVGVIALLGHLAYAFSHIYALEQDRQIIAAETTKVFRTVIPKGRMVDPVKQLKRKVGALQGHNSPGFIALYEPVAAVLAGEKGVRLQSLTYNQAEQELRLTLLLPSFKAIETIRRDIEQHNLKAELTGSSNEANGTRARLRIKG